MVRIYDGIEQLTAYNPLSILDPKSDNFSDHLDDIANALIISQGKEPHWDDSARELVAGLIAYVVESPDIEASLPFVRSMLTKPFEKLVEVAINAQLFGEESIAKRKLGRFAGVDIAHEHRELQSIISNALTQTAFLDNAALSKNLLSSTPGFSFDCLIEGGGNSTIFLVLPVDKLNTYGRWLRLMVSIGIRTVGRNTNLLDYPVLFVLDEFGTIGCLPAISQALGLMAGLQMRLWIFVQDLLQLKRDYPADWETFISNSDYITFFDIMDQFTADYVSNLIGKTTIERICQNTVMQRTGGQYGITSPFYSDMSDQYISRDLMQSSEIRRLGDQTGILIGRGNPIIFERVKYFKDQAFANLARKNPYYP